MDIGIEVTPRHFCPAFSFSPVQYNTTNTYVKSYLNSKLQVSYSIHLLGQHLPAQSHRWKHQINV